MTGGATILARDVGSTNVHFLNSVASLPHADSSRRATIQEEQATTVS